MSARRTRPWLLVGWRLLSARISSRGLFGGNQVDSFEWNKIGGWVLAALIAVLGLSIVTGFVYKPAHVEQKGYIVEGVEEEGGAEAGPAKEADKPIAFYLATASAEKGAAQFKKCAGCHTINKGGPAGSGPNLWGIMGAKHAHQAGFAYSDAIKSIAGPWDWDAMDHWLKSPKAYAPGTKMSFAGISKPQDRAALLVYLNTQSDKPLPLPPVPAEEPAAAPAADAAAAPAAADAGAAAPQAAPAA